MNPENEISDEARKCAEELYHLSGFNDIELAIIQRHMDAYHESKSNTPQGFDELFKAYGLPKDEGQLKRIWCAGFRSGYKTHESKSKELVRDKERLDKLQDEIFELESYTIDEPSGATLFVLTLKGSGTFRSEILREVIDTAMTNTATKEKR